MTGLKAMIVDIDGTAALNNSGRPWFGPGFERRVFEDDVNTMVDTVVSALYRDGIVDAILFTTGRMEVARAETLRWIGTKVGWDLEDDGVELFMRKDGDFRPDHEVKREIYDEHIRHVYDVRLALDDKPSLIELWRSLDIPAWQVNEYR